jgi:hypothetical protein
VLRWAISFAVNRLVLAAVLLFLIHQFLRTNEGFGDSLVDQFNRRLGFEQLYRALDRDD